MAASAQYAGTASGTDTLEGASGEAGAFRDASGNVAAPVEADAEASGGVCASRDSSTLVVAFGNDGGSTLPPYAEGLP